MMHRLTPAYCEHVPFPPYRASTLLNNYGNLLTWGNDDETIADVGCANGAITTDILLPFCAGKVREIIGIDISRDMLQMANKRNTKSNVTFIEMDIAKKHIDRDMVGRFDHIFSFYCLHHIADQKQLADNLFKMLKPNGEVFITFLIKHAHIESWFTISKYDRWSNYLTEYPKRTSETLTSANPRGDFDRVFADAGFSVQSFEVEGQTERLNRQELEDRVTNINLPIDYIPEHLRGAFIKDQLELMTELCKIGESYDIPYKEIVAIARKS